MATDLPRALRRTFFDRIDPRLTALVGVSLLGHAGCVGYLRTLDLPELPTVVDSRPVRYRMPAAPPLLPPPVPMPAAKLASAAPGKPKPTSPPKGERHARLDDSAGDIRNSPLLKALARRNATDEVLGGAAAVDSAFDGVVASNDNASRGLTSKHDSDSARVRHGRDVLFAGPDAVATGDAREHTVVAPPGFKPPPPEAPVKPLALPSLMSAIRPLQRALTRCYDRQLKLTGPGIRGRVELTLFVARDGSVRDTQVTHDTSGDVGLGECFRAVLTQAHFPAGTAARVVIPLQLLER